MEDFDTLYDAYRQKVESALLSLLPPATTEPGRIHAAMHYSVAAGGKRLRPVLVLACANLYPSVANPLPAAAAIEWLHTYTLIHDDLPAMDDSPLRRGRPSLHVQFDEATAILAGDALLTEAFAALAHHYAEQPELGLNLIRILGRAADSRHLIGGQVVDTLSENSVIGADRLDFIHLHKTADLLQAACIMGLHCCDFPPAALTAIEAFGRHLGMAFQIVDDILDATSDAQTMGKTVGNDARQAKNTYVSLHGIEASRAAAAQHTRMATQALQNLPHSADFLAALVQQLEFRIQ